jgi:transcriptional repressor NrdR
MICPFCLYKDTKVVDSREQEGYGTVRRRRECLKCTKRFTTHERCTVELNVVKRDGRKEVFDRDKFRMGIIRACSKRPVGIDALDNIADKIESRLRRKGNEVKSQIIGGLVMQELKKIDKVAYLRFASVYRDFDDVASFEKEAKLLMT